MVLVDTNDASTNVASVTYASNTLTVNADFTGGVTNTEVATAIQAFNGGADFSAAATGAAATGLAAGDASAGITPTYLVNGRDAGSTTFSVTADTAGTAANGVTVTITEDNTIAANSVTAAIVSGNIDVRVNGTVTKSAIVSAINGLAGYTATTTTSSGDTNYVDSSDTPPGVATLGGGSGSSGGLSDNVTLQIGGADGVEIFTFQAGTSISALQAAISAFSDSTGVTATVNGTTLELTSTAYGSDAFVDVRVLSENSSGTVTTGLGSTSSRSEGSDVVATVNGISALGNGNELSLATSSLSLTTSAEAGFTGTINFTITGGGALFQLGPDVVSNQQARFGITSVNTSLLGGTSGKLFSLKSGESASLANDPTTAARIVNDAINKITSLRGRLGSFQRTTLETNKNALGDTLVNLTDAESTVRDADFAAETAALTRAQILVQSGTTVLAVANQNPQNVLALLR